jgi:hypothetical protein
MRAKSCGRACPKDAQTGLKKRRLIESKFFAKNAEASDFKEDLAVSRAIIVGVVEKVTLLSLDIQEDGSGDTSTRALITLSPIPLTHESESFGRALDNGAKFIDVQVDYPHEVSLLGNDALLFWKRRVEAGDLVGLWFEEIRDQGNQRGLKAFLKDIVCGRGGNVTLFQKGKPSQVDIDIVDGKIALELKKERFFPTNVHKRELTPIEGHLPLRSFELRSLKAQKNFNTKKNCSETNILFSIRVVDF